jgi:hypothetical protein
MPRNYKKLRQRCIKLGVLTGVNKRQTENISGG